MFFFNCITIFSLFKNKLNLILYSSLFLLHFVFFAPFFIYDVNFIFFHFFALFLFPTLIIYPPFALSKSFFILLVISYLSSLSYNNPNLFPPVLILSHLLLIVWLWLGVIFVGVGFVSWVVLFCAGRTCKTA